MIFLESAYYMSPNTIVSYEIYISCIILSLPVSISLSLTFSLSLSYSFSLHPFRTLHHHKFSVTRWDLWAGNTFPYLSSLQEGSLSRLKKNKKVSNKNDRDADLAWNGFPLILEWKSVWDGKRGWLLKYYEDVNWQGTESRVYFDSFILNRVPPSKLGQAFLP